MTITIEQAQAELPTLIGRLSAGEEVVITQDNRPVARLTALPPSPVEDRKFGTMRGTVLFMSPDFNKPMELRDAAE